MVRVHPARARLDAASFWVPTRFVRVKRSLSPSCWVLDAPTLRGSPQHALAIYSLSPSCWVLDAPTLRGSPQHALAIYSLSPSCWVLDAPTLRGSPQHALAIYSLSPSCWVLDAPTLRDSPQHALACCSDIRLLISRNACNFPNPDNWRKLHRGHRRQLPSQRLYGIQITIKA